MDNRLAQLEEECRSLNEKLVQQSELKDEIETLKNELEKSLETHKKLQEVALAFEIENREMREKYNAQLKEKSNVDVMNIELEQEVESKNHSYNNLEKRFNKLKEKLTKYEQMEDTVYTIEKENERQKDRIAELQDTLQAYEKGREKREKEFEEKNQKLIKENNDLNIKLECYVEETEDLDARNITLEKQNKDLNEQFERLKDIEIIGSSFEQIQSLENRISSLEENLEKEKEMRETAENELFRIEEEYENYKTEIENKEKTCSDIKLTQIENDLDEAGDSEANVKSLLSRKDLIIHNLNAERNELQENIHLIEQAHEILIEENNELTKLNLQHEERKNDFLKEKQSLIEKYEAEVARLKESHEIEVASLKYQLNTSKLDTDDVTINNTGDNFLELEKTKNSLKNVEDLLEESRTKELNAEEKVKLLEKEHASEVIQLQEQYTVLRDEDRHNIINELSMKFDQERTTYESRIMALNTVIAHLEERVLSLKSFYEPKSISIGGSTPSPDSTPPVPIKNGRLHDSMDEIRDYNYNGFRRMTGDSEYRRMTGDSEYRRMTGESEDELDEKTLTDRELRRISYKIASGDWSQLEVGLRVSAQDASLIQRSSSNDQEKVYRILVSWRNDANLNRLQLLKELSENIDPKRKDVVKFLKEMAGLTNYESTGVKKRFRQFKKSIRR